MARLLVVILDELSMVDTYDRARLYGGSTRPPVRGRLRRRSCEGKTCTRPRLPSAEPRQERDGAERAVGRNRRQRPATVNMEATAAALTGTPVARRAPASPAADPLRSGIHRIGSQSSAYRTVPLHTSRTGVPPVGRHDGGPDFMDEEQDTTGEKGVAGMALRHGCRRQAPA